MTLMARNRKPPTQEETDAWRRKCFLKRRKEAAIERLQAETTDSIQPEGYFFKGQDSPVGYLRETF
jgi:hypothetical protein